MARPAAGRVAIPAARTARSSLVRRLEGSPEPRTMRAWPARFFSACTTRMACAAAVQPSASVSATCLGVCFAGTSPDGSTPPSRPRRKDGCTARAARSARRSCPRVRRARARNHPRGSSRPLRPCRTGSQTGPQGPAGPPGPFQVSGTSFSVARLAAQLPSRRTSFSSSHALPGTRAPLGCGSTTRLPGCHSSP